MPRFRNGPLEWTVAGVLLVGAVAIWYVPSYAWLPLVIMGYVVGYYTGRRSNERDRPPERM
ncbi:MAG TPA: hypothetical protein VGE94_00425 [Chloroflexota bacterium]|jgi:hypothetical protein